LDICFQISIQSMADDSAHHCRCRAPPAIVDVVRRPPLSPPTHARSAVGTSTPQSVSATSSPPRAPARPPPTIAAGRPRSEGRSLVERVNSSTELTPRRRPRVLPHGRRRFLRHVRLPPLLSVFARTRVAASSSASVAPRSARG
jgi:hypothetical protein